MNQHFHVHQDQLHRFNKAVSAIDKSELIAKHKLPLAISTVMPKRRTRIKAPKLIYNSINGKVK